MFGGGGVWWRPQWKQAFSVCGWFGVKQTFTWIIESQRTGEYWSIQVSSPLTCLCLSLSLAWGGGGGGLDKVWHETFNTALLSVQHRVTDQSIYISQLSLLLSM